MYNYSIIIPHKNLPKLLQRCLNSIPDRDDVETIVVDDNSDPSVVDFAKFPGLQKKNVQVVFDKKGLGAGHARNVGLLKASGKWLVFADCDDFFEKDVFDNQMNALVDSPAELIFFNFLYRDSENLNRPAKKHNLNNLIEKYENTGNVDCIRFAWNAPWGKFIRRSLVVEKKISFQETQWSNDVQFSMDVAINAKKVVCKNENLYCYTYRQGSLVSVLSFESCLCRLKVSLENEKKLIANGHGQYRQKHIEYWHYKLFFLSPKKFFEFVKPVVDVIGLFAFVRGLLSNTKNLIFRKRCR